jgi:hypothetical protein
MKDTWHLIDGHRCDQWSTHVHPHVNIHIAWEEMVHKLCPTYKAINGFTLEPGKMTKDCRLVQILYLYPVYSPTNSHSSPTRAACTIPVLSSGLVPRPEVYFALGCGACIIPNAVKPSITVKMMTPPHTHTPLLTLLLSPPPRKNIVNLSCCAQGRA